MSENTEKVKGEVLEGVARHLSLIGPSLLGPKELIIREGQALPVKEPIKIGIVGIIDSPLRWLEKRIDTFNHNEAHVLVDRENMIISLIIDEEDPYRPVITGKLEYHPAFKKFGINEGEYLTPFEMADLIKMNRTFFENQSAAMNLVSTLKNFKAKVDKQVEAADDNRGNKRALVDQAVESNLPEKFNMVIPIFKGQKKEKIEVEVYIKAQDLTCTLISPEANDITEILRDTAISEVLKGIEALSKDIAIIEQ